MIKSFRFLGLSLMAGLCAGSAARAADPAPPVNFPVMKGHHAKVDKLPDWSGAWENISGFLIDRFAAVDESGRAGKARFVPAAPPYNAEYGARYKEIVAAAEAGRPSVDPTANCIWPGMPRLMFQPFPFEFSIEPGIVHISHEYMSQVRRIFTDGRGHPEDYDATYNGHSTGHWEGDTLVVETVGLKDSTLIQTGGMIHSDALKIVERIRLAEPDILEDQMTLIDPKAFTKPYLTTRYFKRHRDWQILDYVCAENNRNPQVDGVTTVVQPGDPVQAPGGPK